MDRAIIFLLCITTTLCFSQRSEYLEFVKADILIKPIETLESLINEPVSSLYKPANRYQLSDNQEKHLQLNINLFRKQQYSLLLKSMQSYERTYGQKKDHGLHQFFQIVILEDKLSKQSNIHNQMISLASKGMTEHSEHDLNLRFAFQKTLIKYYYLSEKWDLLDLEIRKLSEYSNKIHSSQEFNWSEQIKMEVLLARGKMPNALGKLQLPDVIKASYIIYDGLMKSDYSSVASRYLAQKWHNSSHSLLNNLIFTALITEKDDRARVLISRLSMNLGKADANLDFYSMILNENPDQNYPNTKFNIVSKLIKLKNKPTVIFTKDEQRLIPEDFNKYIWRSRLEHFVLSEKQDEYLKYMSAIPFYRLDMSETNFILNTNKKYLQKIYSNFYYDKKYDLLIEHWQKISSKSSLKNYIDDDLKFYISAAYIMKGKDSDYYNLVRGDSKQLINNLESLKSFKQRSWAECVKYALNTKRVEIMAFKALSYMELNQRLEAQQAFEQVLTINADIRGEIKQDFFMGYIRLITSSNKSPEYVYQRLNRIQSGIKHLGITSNRVNEAIEAHLIGINMTLKKTSFEKLLTSVNSFLKNYPRSQFYSMINLTRAKILAQLRKIKESMEVLQNLVKNTNDEKIKIEALDELTILKNK